MPYAGFDAATYPGPIAMQWLWDNTNLWWVGHYLPVAGPGLLDKYTWKGTYTPLREMGWGVAPIYVGKQPNSVKLRKRAGKEVEEGKGDGVEAAQLAAVEQIPRGATIYFDLEMPDFRQNWKTYFGAWVDAVIDEGYRPGLYCSHLSGDKLAEYIKQISNAKSPSRVPAIWAVKVKESENGAAIKNPQKHPNPHPSGSGSLYATSWQLRHANFTFWALQLGPKQQKLPLRVDLNSSVYSDPGMRTWGHGEQD